ncbi:MAG: LemA family protein [Phenylobacterium sp.]|jgi:LemA protein|uniref:LemA family protein n=1 Tax=Phenylobacterium sp. TaxID=1871053 RepID=UPI002A31DCFE|nr:LemA family protein [Phenylobacterium sp.]MDD3836926.1 LemA family protein [Phenylobacterium sp.]MDX9997578.1 LemA family protein [Phenylobacterium sp.]
MLSRLARLALLIVAPLALAGCGYNTIPTKEEQAKAAWANVQATYQRRADLIPNLVETVRGYAAQERAVLTEVIEARARATAVTVDASTLTDPEAMQRYAAAQDQLSGVLGRLMMIQERYPELKSNQNFLALQNEIEATENRINIARRDYNEAVRDYNTSLRTFPTIIWAKTLHSGSKPMQLFTASATAQSAPTVDFGTVGAPPAGAAAPATPGGDQAPVTPGSAPPPALPAQPAPAQ